MEKWNSIVGQCAATGSVIILMVSGCASPWLQRKKDPAVVTEERLKEVKDLWTRPDRPRRLVEISRKVITGARVENVALVTELPGTGGKAEASSQRERMLDLMRHKNVPNPNQWLDDPSTALVVAQVLVPPASRKGDRVNALIKLSSHAEATNLQSGWLMRTELVEMSVLGGQVREGFGYAMAEGQLVTEQQISGSTDPEAAKAAMVVGGAVLMESRKIGLAIADDYAHAVTMSAVLPVINKRFTVFDGTKQDGAAKPKQQNYIELNVPSRYRKDPDHFANVVLNLGVAETAAERLERMEQCRLELAEPTTARRAAWQLEAIGKESIPILAEGLKHPDQEVRFYAAHALAYLNDARSIPTLHDLAISEPAFRAMCLNGLSLVENFQASDSLEDLLQVNDAETRYGALLALRDHDTASTITQGEQIGKVGTIVEIQSAGPPQVVVGLTKVPEVVIFGANPTLQFNAFMYVNPRLLLRTVPGGRISVSHIVPGRDDRIVECTADLRSVLSAIAEVGGGYGDWVNFIRVCGVDKLISAEVAINPVPDSGRKYHRDGDASEPGNDAVTDAVKDVAPPPLEASASSAKKSNGTWNPLTWFEN